MLFIDNCIKKFFIFVEICESLIFKIIWDDYIKGDNFYLKNENF